MRPESLDRTLIVSEVEPERSTTAVSGEPEEATTSWKPSAIDNSVTRIVTTRAMPITATAEGAMRSRSVARLILVTAKTCRSQANITLSSEPGRWTGASP